jgi:hypothetical protein
MNYREWKIFYHEILKDFGFSEEKDREAAKILKREVSSRTPISVIRDRIEGRRVNIYGAGPSLEKIKDFSEGTVIAADGATSYLLKKGVIPDIIVTDLDGNVDDLLRANTLGSLMIIHAHGDNIDAIRKYARKFHNCITTTQSEPFDEVYNFGGFTDGDRAVFLAAHFNAKEICLYGMDFFGEVGRYSFSEGGASKKKKLAWAERLITYLKKKGNIYVCE